MGQPQPITVPRPLTLIPGQAQARSRVRSPRLIRHVPLILVGGLLAVAYLCACVRATAIDAARRQVQDESARLEAEIGELVVQNAVFADPTRIRNIAVAKGYAPPAAHDRVAVSPRLLSGTVAAERRRAAERPMASAWAQLGPAGP